MELQNIKILKSKSFVGLQVFVVSVLRIKGMTLTVD